MVRAPLRLGTWFRPGILRIAIFLGGWIVVGRHLLSFARLSDQAHSVLQEAAESFRPQDQDLSILEEEQGEPSPYQNTFDSDKDLTFSLSKFTWNLADMELDDDNATSSFAVSGDLPLFSVAAIGRMREGLLTNMFGKGSKGAAAS